MKYINNIMPPEFSKNNKKAEYSAYDAPSTIMDWGKKRILIGRLVCSERTCTARNSAENRMIRFLIAKNKYMKSQRILASSCGCTVGRNGMKSTHSFHRQRPLPHELRNEWASERTNERSGARERSEQCGASEWVSGASERANGGWYGPVIYALIS